MTSPNDLRSAPAPTADAKNPVQEKKGSFAAPAKTLPKPYLPISRIVCITGLLLLILGKLTYLYWSMVAGLVCEALALLAFLSLSVHYTRRATSQPEPGGRSRGRCAYQVGAMVLMFAATISILSFGASLIFFFFLKNVLNGAFASNSGAYENVAVLSIATNSSNNT